MWTKVLLTLWLSTCGLDASTSHIILGRGGWEQNPLMVSNKWAVDAGVGGEAVVGGLLMRRHTHRKLIILGMIGATVAHGVAGVHNLKELNK